MPKLPMFRLKGFSEKFLTESKNNLDQYLAKLLQVRLSLVFRLFGRGGGGGGAK